MKIKLLFFLLLFTSIKSDVFISVFFNETDYDVGFVYNEINKAEGLTNNDKAKIRRSYFSGPTTLWFNSKSQTSLSKTYIPKVKSFLDVKNVLFVNIESCYESKDICRFRIFNNYLEKIQDYSYLDSKHLENLPSYSLDFEKTDQKQYKLILLGKNIYKITRLEKVNDGDSLGICIEQLTNQVFTYSLAHKMCCNKDSFEIIKWLIK